MADAVLLSSTSRVALADHSSPIALNDQKGNSAPVRLPQLRLHFGMDRRESDNDSDGAPKRQRERKRPRFLSDIDRSIIIQRLEKGEKQADLAREFGVTRAAICHINKNKHEVLTRFDEFARSPHGRILIENYSRPSTEFENVTEVRTTAATVLTTRIKDKTTLPRSFRAAADRLIKLLLEEALVSFGSASISPDSAESLMLDSTPCGVALGRDGTFMVEIFQSMEPDAGTGSICGTERLSESSSAWQVMTVDLPEIVTSTGALLVTPALSSATFACSAIEELRLRGVPPASICIVCITCTVDAAREMALHHPDIAIITAALEKQPLESVDSGDEFLQRYFASHVEP